MKLKNVALLSRLETINAKTDNISHSVDYWTERLSKQLEEYQENLERINEEIT